MELGELEPAFDPTEGQDAETVAIRAIVPVTALIYQPADAAAQAIPRLQDALATQAPAGYAMDPSSVVISEPTPDEGGGESQFRITAEGRALAPFPDTERTRLASALAGKSPSDAEKILQEQPAIQAFRITYKPDWLLDRMPSSAGRIDLDITR